MEYIQTDIWVRYQKLKGHNCFYVCAADAHGTPIMIKADEEGIKPEDLVKRISKEQYNDLNDFGVNFDNFYSTHSPSVIKNLLAPTKIYVKSVYELKKMVRLILKNRIFLIVMD